MKIKQFFFFCIVFCSLKLIGQNNSEPIDFGTFSGNIQAISQYYQEDTLINAALPDQILEDLDVTIGSFYEQYGSGMILRAYEERQLGIDNALDGIKVKYSPFKGIYLKGLIGKQRHQFIDGLVNGNGLVRGFDGEIDVNELFDTLAPILLLLHLLY